MIGTSPTDREVAVFARFTEEQLAAANPFGPKDAQPKDGIRDAAGRLVYAVPAMERGTPVEELPPTFADRLRGELRLDAARRREELGPDAEVQELTEALASQAGRVWNTDELTLLAAGIADVWALMQRAERVGEQLDAATQHLAQNDAWAKRQLTLHRRRMMWFSGRGEEGLAATFDMLANSYAPVELLSADERAASRFYQEVSGVFDPEDEFGIRRWLLRREVQQGLRELRQAVEIEVDGFKSTLAEGELDTPALNTESVSDDQAVLEGVTSLTLGEQGSTATASPKQRVRANQEEWQRLTDGLAARIAG